MIWGQIGRSSFSNICCHIFRLACCEKGKVLICLIWSICWHHPKSCKRRMQSFVPFTFRFPTTHRTFVSGPFSCLFSHNCTSLLSELTSELCSYPFLSHQPAPTFINFGAFWSVELSLCACCSICLNLGVDSDTLVSNKNVDRVAAREDLDQYIFHPTHTCQLYFCQLCKEKSSMCPHCKGQICMSVFCT